MESQPQNPEFRNNHENFHASFIWTGSYVCLCIAGLGTSDST